MNTVLKEKDEIIEELQSHNINKTIVFDDNDDNGFINTPRANIGNNCELNIMELGGVSPINPVIKKKDVNQETLVYNNQQ